MYHRHFVTVVVLFVVVVVVVVVVVLICLFLLFLLLCLVPFFTPKKGCLQFLVIVLCFYSSGCVSHFGEAQEWIAANQFVTSPVSKSVQK